MSVMKKPTKINIKVGPILSITKKTFFVNLCTPAKLIGSIIIITLVPILFIFMIPPFMITSMTSLTEQLGVIMFFYSFGLMYPIAIGTSAAPLIAEEVSSGTMLTLVSKPIKRIGIVTGKFMALIIFGILLSLISLIFISVFALIRHPFYDILIFIELNLIYSIIIIIFFGGLTLGFSALFKRARNVTIIPIIIVIFSFLILMIAKQLLTMSAMYSTEPSYYEQLQLYHFDEKYFH